jgi:hypothetical protein
MRKIDFKGFGSALRAAFGAPEFYHPIALEEKGWEPPPCSTLDEALERVNDATESLKIVAALKMDPTDLAANEDGIALALRRLSKDIR